MTTRIRIEIFGDDDTRTLASISLDGEVLDACGGAVGVTQAIHSALSTQLWSAQRDDTASSAPLAGALSEQDLAELLNAQPGTRHVERLQERERLRAQPPFRCQKCAGVTYDLGRCLACQAAETH